MIHQVKRWLKKVTSPFPQFACGRKQEGTCGLINCTVHHYCVAAQAKTDYWYKRDGAYVCSYCGGIKPSEVMRFIRSGEASDVERTTKFYKYYLHTKIGTFKIYMPHFNKEEWDLMIKEARERDILDAWKKNFQK